MSTVRPRRSALFVPGINERALAKAKGLPVDVVIMDLEDSVAPERKAQARSQIAAALGSGGYGTRELVVRVNAVDTPWWTADIEALARDSVAGLLLPKVNGPEDIRRVAEVLDRSASPGTRLWVMAETPGGVLRLDAIAGADPRLECIVVGTEDLGSAMRVPKNPERPGLVSALAVCVLAARAHDLDVLDSPYPGIQDPAGLRRSCEQARMLGFDGKTLIHPSQIGAANEIFHPDSGDLEDARAIVAAWDRRDPGQEVIVVNGAMVERLHARAARRVLDLYAAVESARHG